MIRGAYPYRELTREESTKFCKCSRKATAHAGVVMAR